MADDKQAKKSLFHHLKLDEYSPDPKKINMALWGKETPPSNADINKAKLQLDEMTARMRSRNPL